MKQHFIITTSWAQTNYQESLTFFRTSHSGDQSLKVHSTPWIVDRQWNRVDERAASVVCFEKSWLVFQGWNNSASTVVDSFHPTQKSTWCQSFHLWVRNFCVAALVFFFVFCNQVELKCAKAETVHPRRSHTCGKHDRWKLSSEETDGAEDLLSICDRSNCDLPKTLGDEISQIWR